MVRSENQEPLTANKSRCILDKNANACYNVIMNNSFPNQSPKPRRESRATYNVRRAVVAGGLLLSAFAGKGVYDNIGDERANQKQPACEVPVHSGDTIFGIQAELEAAGDYVRGDLVRVQTPGPDSRERTAQTDKHFYNGSQGMQPGDTLIINHVDPAACEDVGGTSLRQETASQK